MTSDGESLIFYSTIGCADDHRLFCGDLGNEVNDEVLTKAFTRFASFNMARVSTSYATKSDYYSCLSASEILY